MDHISVSDLLEVSSDDKLIAVAGTADVYSKSHKISSASAMCLMYKATVAAGSPDIDLYLEQGPGLPAGAVGGGEGEAGNATDGWHQVGNKIADVTDENWHSITISPVVLPYLRIKADGQGDNPASCTLQIKIGKIESLS
jgi:hypothetical protein